MCHFQMAPCPFENLGRTLNHTTEKHDTNLFFTKISDEELHLFIVERGSDVKHLNGVTFLEKSLDNMSTKEAATSNHETCLDLEKYNSHYSRILHRVMQPLHFLQTNN